MVVSGSSAMESRLPKGDCASSRPPFSLYWIPLRDKANLSGLAPSECTEAIGGRDAGDEPGYGIASAPAGPGRAEAGAPVIEAGRGTRARHGPVFEAGWASLAQAHRLMAEIPPEAADDAVLTKQLAVQRYATALLVRLRRLQSAWRDRSRGVFRRRRSI